MSETTKGNVAAGPFRSYGVRVMTELTSDIDRSVEEIQLSGFSIVPTVLSQSDLEMVFACRLL